MSKDISQYINFSDSSNGLTAPKRSLKSLINVPITVISWELRESHFADRSPQDMYACIVIETSSGRYKVNTSNPTVMAELDQIQQAKANALEQDMSFTCTVKRHGEGLRLCPVDWSRKDVRAQMGEKALVDGGAAEGD